MPKPKKGARLGGSASHQAKILANLATQLFEHGKITTTETKAKNVRPYAERLISKAKRGTLADRRNVLKTIRDKDVVHKLFAEIGPHFAERDGGYTRIIKIENRKGDNAPMAIISLVTEQTASAEADRATRVAASKKATEAENVVADVEAEAAEEADADADAGSDTEGAEESTDTDAQAEETAKKDDE